MKTQIKIVVDTPFDKEDTLLSIKDFRLKYSYACSKGVTDEDLVKYLKAERKLWFKAANPRDTRSIGYWFTVMQEPVYPFGDGEVTVYKTDAENIVIACESKKAKFHFEEIRDWYNHFLHTMMGFTSFDNADARFEGLVMNIPEEHHLDSMVIERLDLIKIKVGCLTGTVEELLVILNECKKLEDETKGQC